MQTKLILGLMSLSLALVACGGGESRCDEVMTRFCDMACECAAGDTCIFHAESGTASSTIEFDTRSDCLAMYVGLACGGSEKPPAEFLDACDAALETAGCVDVDVDRRALLVPDACDTAD